MGFLAFVAACTGPTVVSETTTTLGTTTTTTTTLPPTTAIPGVEGKPYGGMAVVAEEHEPTTLNPYAPGGDELIVSLIGQAYFAGVYEIDARTLELVPDVVTELPTTSNGGVVINDDGTMTVKYTILDEAMWDDGHPISGDDLAFTVDTLKTPEAYAGFGIDKVYEWITSYEAGPKTFEMTLNQPTIIYEQLFRVILPKHAVEGSDFLADWNDHMWPSGGPFRFAGWERGDRLTVERNDSFWKADPETGQRFPYLDAVEFRFIPEAGDVLRAFRRRDVQVIQPPPAVATIDELKALEPSGARVDVLAGPVWEHLNFQFGPGRRAVNPTSLNANLDYRRAVAYLIDRDAVAAAAGKYVEPLTSYVDMFSPTLSQHAWDRYPYDPRRARQLLDKVKENQGIETITAVFSTTSTGDTSVRVSDALRPMFEEVGIELRVELQPRQLFFGTTLETGSWDIGLWAWVGSPGFTNLVTIHDAFDPEAPPPGGSNYYRWGTEDSSVRNEHTERFAEVRDLMNSTVNDVELEALINEAEDILAERLVVLPLYGLPVVGAVWEDEIAGFAMNPSQGSHTWNIGEWYRADL